MAALALFFYETRSSHSSDPASIELNLRECYVCLAAVVELRASLAKLSYLRRGLVIEHICSYSATSTLPSALLRSIATRMAVAAI